jgi:Protein of unknown function (DUF2934)
MSRSLSHATGAQATTAARAARVQPDPAANADSHVAREDRVRTAAYFEYLKRGCLDGYDLDDWLAAERQVDVQAEARSGADH